MAVPFAHDPPALLTLLADGALHSGEQLARGLGVSRAAVWKSVERLRGRGIEVRSLPGRGYALSEAVELLDANAVRAALSPERAASLGSLSIRFEVDSTNTRLLAQAAPPFGTADALLGELQHQGRGRRGRPWLAPFGASIALSLGWCFRDSSSANPALSLCVGVAVARALVRAGARGIGLKWPNDVWYDDRKLGGILVELRAEASGAAHVVIGIGINVSLDARSVARLDAWGVRAASVAEACRSRPSRNSLAGAIIDELVSMLATFERQGFAPFRAEWSALDALSGRAVRLSSGESIVDGTARGVDARGALRLDSEGRIHRFVAGEASLRVAEPL